LSLRLFKHNKYGFHEILTGALDQSERSDLCPNRFRPGEGAQGTKRIRDWAVPTTGVDSVEKENIFGSCREVNTKVLAVCSLITDLSAPATPLKHSAVLERGIKLCLSYYFKRIYPLFKCLITNLVVEFITSFRIYFYTIKTTSVSVFQHTEDTEFLPS
jgi:hypothetical protein